MVAGEIGEVVAPTDPVRVQPVEDRPVRRSAAEERRHVGGDAPVGGAREQEAPVRDRLARRRAEPPVRDRERPRERVREREHLRRVVPHRLGRGDRLDEPVHPAAVDLLVRRIPRLRHMFRLRGRGKGERAHERRRAARTGVGVRRRAARIEAQPVGGALPGTREGTEQVVERVVLHHHHDDVIERHLLVCGAGGHPGVGQALGAPKGARRLLRMLRVARGYCASPSTCPFPAEPQRPR